MTSTVTGPDAPTTTGVQRGTAWLLAALGVLTTQMAAAAATPEWAGYALEAAVRAIVFAAVGLFVAARAARGWWIGAAAVAAAATDLLLGLSPLLKGYPPAPVEGLLMGALSAAAVVLAVAGGKASRLGGLTGFAVCLLGAVGAGAGVRPALITAACVAGVVFLAAGEAGRTGRTRVPWGATALAGIVVAIACVGTLALLPASEIRSRLTGFLASSGGTERASDTARRGVGDGAEQVQGSDDPRSAGFDVGETFVNSDDPGLYDAFIETFGTPARRSDNPKMIMLRPKDIRLSGAQVGLDLRNGRALELKRSPPPPPSASATQPARENAVLWVTPPAPARPAHLPLAFFDTWDGDRWLPAEWTKHNAALRPDGGPGPGWMSFVDAPSSPLLGREEAWEVRVGRMATDVLPMPANTAAFKVGRVNRADFFVGGGDAPVGLFRRSVPPGTVIQVRARPVADLGAGVPPKTGMPITDLPPTIAARAHEWAAPHPHGWAQVEAVVARLRSHGVHDRSAVSTEHAGVDQLLAPGGRGSALQFASAATLMLRSLGYDTRVASGFYADPARLDRRAGTIPLTAGDAHAWVQVRAQDGTWVTFEPTPGYEVGRPTDLAERAYEWWLVARSHVGWTATLAAVALTGLLLRRRLVDVFATWVFRRSVRRASTPEELRRLGAATVHLLEARAARAGRARANAETPAAFLHRLGLPPGQVRVIERAVYAPGGAEASIRDTVLAAERAAPFRRIATPGHSRSPSTRTPAPAGDSL